jgi:hypothetical protein
VARSHARRGRKAKHSVTVRIDAGGDCAALLRADRRQGRLVSGEDEADTQPGRRGVGHQVDGSPSTRDAFGTADAAGRRDRLRARRTGRPASGASSPCAPVRAAQRQPVVPVGGPGLLGARLSRPTIARTAPTSWHDRYDDRAGIETIIADLKGGFGIGKVSTDCFDANEAAFLLKVLAFNLLRRWVQRHHRAIATWRTPWIRRVCVLVPGRLLRAGGRWELRLAPRPMLV